LPRTSWVSLSNRLFVVVVPKRLGPLRIKEGRDAGYGQLDEEELRTLSGVTGLGWATGNTRTSGAQLLADQSGDEAATRVRSVDIPGEVDPKSGVVRD
jgi:hypothetical protein